MNFQTYATSLFQNIIHFYKNEAYDFTFCIVTVGKEQHSSSFHSSASNQIWRCDSLFYAMLGYLSNVDWLPHGLQRSPMTVVVRDMNDFIRKTRWYLITLKTCNAFDINKVGYTAEKSWTSTIVSRERCRLRCLVVSERCSRPVLCRHLLANIYTTVLQFQFI